MSVWLLVVPFAALFVVVASLSAGVISGGTWLAGFIRRRPSEGSSALRAALVAAPILIASLVCIAVMSAATLDGCHCSLHDLHHPHLCLAHPLFALPLLNIATGIIGAWALFATPRLVGLGRRVMAANRWAAKARLVQPRSVDDVVVRVIDCSSPGAFTIGTLSPFVVFDRSLWNTLTHEQRRAVVHHEQAHARRRDGLTLLFLRSCVAVLPLPEALITRWNAATELCCDQHAAKSVGDETVVADALVAVERARSRALPSANRSLATAMAVISAGTVEHRVLALLGPPYRRGNRSLLGNDVLTLSAFAIGSGVAMWMWPGDSIHHAAETVIGLLGPIL